MTAMTDQPHRVHVSDPQPYRYTVICWNDDCAESLDTYGGQEVIDLAREHVARNGCTLRVEVKSIIEISPEGA